MHSNSPLSLPPAVINFSRQPRRESRTAAKNRGRRAWVHYLCGVGRQSDAIRFCRLHRLPLSLVVSTLPLPQVVSASPLQSAVASSPSVVSALSIPPAVASRPPPPAARSALAPVGEGGVEAQALPDNYNRSAVGVEILQSVELKQDEADDGGVKLVEASSGSLGCESGVGSALKETKRSLQFRSPRGELEGKSGFSQAISKKPVELILGAMGSGWVEAGEGVIGGICRNKEYARVRIVGGSEEWAKCAVSGYNLFNGEVVKVKRVWVSGDGRDAEYEIVGRVELEKQPGVGDMTVKPVGFIGGGLREAEKAIEGEVEAKEVGEEKEILVVEEAKKREVDGGEGFMDKMRKETEVWMALCRRMDGMGGVDGIKEKVNV